MKKKLVLCVVLCLAHSISLMAYQYNFNANSFSSKSKNDNGVWQEWAEWEPSTVTISLDTDKEKLVIKASETFTFDIYDKKVNNNDDGEESNILEYSCVDEDGLKCSFRLRNSKDGSMQIYLDYGNASFVYQVETQSYMYSLFPNYYAPKQGNANTANSNTGNKNSSAATLSLNKTTISSSAAGTTEYITVTTNRNWEIQFPAGGMYTASRYGDNMIKVVINKNTGSARQDHFNVRTTDGSKTIKVSLSQSQGNNVSSIASSSNASAQNSSATYLSLSKTSISAPAAGTTDYITVSTNKEWVIVHPTGTMYSVTRYSSSMIKVVINANTGGTRQDFFIIKTQDGSQQVRVNLSQTQGSRSNSTSFQNGSQSSSSNSQRGYSDFYVDKDNFYVSSSGAYYALRIYLISPVKRRIKVWTDKNWLEEENLEDGGGRFHVKQNNTGANRTGHIYIKEIDRSDKRNRIITVTVVQQGY